MEDYKNALADLAAFKAKHLSFLKNEELLGYVENLEGDINGLRIKATENTAFADKDYEEKD